MNGFVDEAEDRTVRALRARAVSNDGSASAPRSSEDAAAAAERLVARAAREELLDVAYATIDSPFGRLLVARTPRGIVRLAFPEESEDTVLEHLSKRLSPRILHAPGRFDTVARQLDEYFAGSRRTFDTELDWSLIGPFGTLVLQATAAIPYGGVLTYADVAGKAGSPRGSRAAGNALGSNPIPIVIPCHRVLRTGGNLGGYGGGLERKRWLLELEGALQPELS